MVNTYTVAQRGDVNSYQMAAIPVEGFPSNLTRPEAEKLASKARANGLDVVVFNTQSA